MLNTVKTHGDMSCEVKVVRSKDHCVGILRYKAFEAGMISGPDEKSVLAHFRSICRMIDSEGAIVREGILMLGYHNGAFGGNVLFVDGEVIGEWHSDDEEWCHFTASGTTDVTCSAPSPWMLHDAIACWARSGNHTSEA